MLINVYASGYEFDITKTALCLCLCTVTDMLTVLFSSWRWNDPCHQQGILATNWFWHQCCVSKWPHPLCKLIQNLHCVCVCVCVRACVRARACVRVRVCVCVCVCVVQENNFGMKISLQNKWHGKISCSQYENVRGESITRRKHIRCNISILQLQELQMDLKKPNFFKGTISYLENTVFALI